MSNESQEKSQNLSFGCKTCVLPEKFESVKNTKTRSVTNYINALDTGQKWNKNNLNYYFMTVTDTDHSENGSSAIRNWNETQKNNYKIAIQEWDKVSALTLTETQDKGVADIKLVLIDDSGYPYLGHAYFPASTYKGENFVSYNNANDKDFTVGSYDYITMVHEFGHTLGLAHPHDTGGLSSTFPGVTNWSDTGTNQQNQTIYTVMSYNDLNGPLTPNNVQSHGFIKGPMAYDIKTIQTIHSGSFSNAEENTVYNLPTTNSEGTYFQAIHDTGGVDTIDASNATTSVTINLGQATVDGKTSGGGHISQVNGVSGGVTIANQTIIENAIGGSGNDVISGNSADNTLIGNDGADRLSGHSGNDNIEGGDGNDRIYDGSGNDQVDGGAGYDRFYVGPGTDVLRGGSGSDIAYFPGSRRNYRIIKWRNGVYRFIGKGSYYWNRTGRTTLIGITWVKFSGYRRRTRLRRIRPNVRYRRNYNIN